MLRVFPIIPRLYVSKMCCSNYSGMLLVSAIWTLDDKIENLLTSSTQMQNISFHVVDRLRTAAKNAKLLFFIVTVQICYFVTDVFVVANKFP